MLTAVVPHHEHTAELPLMEFTFYQKQLLGNTFGGENPRADIPKLLRLYQRGLLDLESMITRRYSLDEINAGYEVLLAGRNIRGLIVHES